MPTDHTETLHQRYQRESLAELAAYARMTPEQIGDMALELHNALAEVSRIKNVLSEVTARHFAESWNKRSSDQVLEEYLSSGIAQLEAERDALRAEVERLRAVYLDQHDKRVKIEIERNDLRAEVERLKAQYLELASYSAMPASIEIGAKLAQQQGVPEDIASDRAYRNGLIAGFGFGISGDEAGYQRSLNCYQQGIHEALAAAPAPVAVQQQVPEGYRLYLIPKEDTYAFNAACSAANDAFLGGVGPCGVFIAGYRAMLAAAPAPVQAEPLYITHRPLIRNAISLLGIRRPVAPDAQLVIEGLEALINGMPTPAEPAAENWLEVAKRAEPASPWVADTEAAIQLAFELGGLDDGSYHLEVDELQRVLRAALPPAPEVKA